MKSSVDLHKIIQLCVIVIALSISPSLQAQSSSASKSPSVKICKVRSSAEWKNVSAFIDQLVETDGFDRAELVTMFSKIWHVDSVIQLMKPAQASRLKKWAAYRARFIEPVRIKAGVEF